MAVPADVRMAMEPLWLGNDLEMLLTLFVSLETVGQAPPENGSGAPKVPNRLCVRNPALSWEARQYCERMSASFQSERFPFLLRTAASATCVARSSHFCPSRSLSDSSGATYAPSSVRVTTSLGIAPVTLARHELLGKSAGFDSSGPIKSSS